MNFTLEKLKEARGAGIPDEIIWQTAVEADQRFATLKEKNVPLESAFQAYQESLAKPAQPAEPDRDFFSVEDVFSALGGVPEALAVGLPAAAVKGYQGLSMPERSQAIENEMAFAQRVQQDQEDREAAGKATSVGSAIRGALPSLGFSATNLPIAIGAGMAGTAVGGPIAGTASAMAASGTASYRMAGADLLYRAFKTLEENKGSPLTDEEKADAYRELLPFAQDSGLWEAGPEAVSNVLMMKAGKFIFGFGKGKAKELVGEAIEKTNKTLSKKIAENAPMIGKKAAVGVGTVGAEVLSEGVTALGQFPAEKAVTKYAMTGEAAGGVTEYPGGYVQAVKDVAPSTVALTVGLGLVGGGVKLASMPFRQQKTPEQIKRDNIDLDAEREANNLMISPTDEEAKGLQASVERMRQSAQEKKEIYSALEPNDPATQQLGMEIRELEKAVGLAEAEIAKRVTPESEQARLAREIAAEQEGKATKTGKAIDPELTNSIGKMVGLSRDGGLTLEEGFAYRSVGEREVGSIAQEGYMITDPRLVGKEKKPRGQTTQKMFSELNPDAPNAAYGKKDIVIRVRKENVPVGTKGQAVREGDVEVLSYDGTQWVAQTPAEFAQARKPTAEAPTVTPAPVSETITEAEKQQTELAKAITAPEAAAPTEQVAQPIEEAAAQPIKIPTPVEPTTPAPVTEQAAPAEAPAAEPAGIAIGNRVKTKTTPQSFVVEEVLPQSEREVELGEQYYRIKNERTGEMQTVEAKDINPIKAPKATKKMAPIRVKEKATPVPEAERYTFDEAGIRAINFFGGKAPKGLIIVNDTADPNYEMKAGYEPETGDIILNRAYIKKGESIEDILTHELGHYIFSDPKFQADFKSFLASMPDDTRAQIEAIINQSYNKDTNQTQIEERQVMAFTALVKANKDTLSKWENFKNTIKRWINKVLRTNIKLSDEGAMAVFNVGFKRFKSGEKIVRAMEDGTLRTAPEGMTQMDTDYLAAVERGDMATAQRMVDEAAKAAGYDSAKVYHGTNQEFDVFKPGIWGAISFATDVATARDIYAKGRSEKEGSPRVVSAYLSIKKPYQTRSHLGAIAKSESLKKQGFDGIIAETGVYSVFDSSQIKSADPVTYDDAGNVIPLSQRFRPTSPDIRRMAAEPEKPAAEEKPTEKQAEPKRKTVAAIPYGGIVTTPIGINKKTETIVQQQVFSGDVAPSPEKTTEAYDIIEKLLDPKTRGQYAEEINELTRSQMSKDEQRQVDETIGAVKLGNELFKYAVNLAAKGDLRMLQLLFERANDLATSGAGSISTDARNVQARSNLASWVRRAAEAQKKGVVNSIAIQIYGPGVTKEQMDSIIEALNQMNKVKTAEAEQVYDDLETTGEREGVDIRGAVERAIRKADPSTRDPWVMALEILKAIEGFQTFTYQKVKGATKKTIQNLVAGTPFAKNLANFQKKMIDTGASGLNTIFWKTMSDQENKIGPLGEVDMAVNRNLAGIVKDTLIRLGLKGDPKDTKMSIFEQVANILAANETPTQTREGEFVTKAVPLSQAKMLEADRIVTEEINRREAKAIEDAGDNAELQQIAEAEANALRQAWDEAMSRQLDIPISDATLRRLIFAQLKQSESSLRELTDAIVNDNVTGTARKEGLLTSVIQQLDGLTKEGDTKRDYTKLREALSAQLDQMVENTILKKRMNSAIRKVAKESNPDKQAERQIERLADLQSDVQAWPKTREDKVRDIVREDLQQRLDLGLKVRDKIRAAWKGVLRQKLIDAGVKESTAERLTDIVWRQHEINYLNRKMKDVEMAVTRGPIAPIVNAIKNTPLSQQQDPKWKRKVAYEYLVNAGLDKDTAGRVADLMDLTLQKVFVRAQEKAFNDIVGRKLDTPNSRRQMQRFLQAIRAGALDPTKNLTSEIAAQNGWTGFTSEQVAKLNELDTIVSDPKALDLQRSTAFKEIQDILKTSKLDPTVTETLSAYYTAQALSGIPTTTVNIFSAVGFSMRNAMTDTMRLAATNPSALPAVFDTFISSWKTYASEVIYSFKNNVQRRGTVEYLSNDDALLRLYNKGKRQWNEGRRSEGFKNMLFGMMEYVGRWLKALDEGAVSVLEQQGLTRYAMMAMKQAGISSKDANAAANYVQSQKQQFIVNAVAKGMNKTEAKALSDDVFRGAWIEALSNLKIESQEVLDSALNDSLSAIGRMNNTFDQLRQETRDIKDNGFVSSLPIGLLERLGEAMNSPSATEGQRIFYRMVYGFAVVPARVMREAAWYSPYGFVRFAIDAFAKGRGKGSPYAQSLGTDLQFRQRLTETIAGSIVLGALMALSQGSVDDPEDESPFKIVVTGNGPERRLDPQFHDAFFKKYSRNALHVFIGKTKFKINIERGFEAFAIPFMLAGAIDDWRIRKRFEQSKKTPSDLSDASILLGSAFLSFSRRGPFAAYMDGIISSKNSDEAITSLGSFLTFTGKTFVPIAGTSLARNISDFISDPVERRSMEGALWANTPVIGPMMGTKSMNAIGETTGAGELSDRFYKLGVPIVFNLPGTPEQKKLRDLIIEKGQGPDIPTRYDARRALGFEPTDQQFERYITAYGQYMKQRMLDNYTSLDGKTPVKYVEQLQVYQKTARLRAKEAVTKNISQP